MTRALRLKEPLAARSINFPGVEAVGHLSSIVPAVFKYRENGSVRMRFRRPDLI